MVLSKWHDKYLALKDRHKGKIEKGFKAIASVGRGVLSAGVAAGLGAADQRFGTEDPKYPNLGMAKLGPVPVSLLVAAAGIGGEIYGHKEEWAPFAGAAGHAAAASWGYPTGRKLVIDFESK